MLIILITLHNRSSYSIKKFNLFLLLLFFFTNIDLCFKVINISNYKNNNYNFNKHYDNNKYVIIIIK